MRYPLPHKAPDKPGFTLVELLVATLLLSIVMAAVYTAFSSSIRLWRLGEANIQTFQDARTSLGIMTRELQNIVPNVAHLVEGTDDDLQFFAVVPPMNVEDGERPCVMWVRYRTRKDPGAPGKILERQERLVTSPLPSSPPKPGEVDTAVIKMANEKDFELARGVKDFKLSYYWVPPKKQPDALAAASPPPPTEFIVREDNPKGTGIPQGIKVVLTLLDPNAESGETTFTTYAVFHGATTHLKADPLSQQGGQFQ